VRYNFFVFFTSASPVFIRHDCLGLSGRQHVPKGKNYNKIKLKSKKAGKEMCTDCIAKSSLPCPALCPRAAVSLQTAAPATKFQQVYS
jgi:hypothetical protein